MVDADILKGSAAWERLMSGPNPEITDVNLRRTIHDWVQVLQVAVSAVNGLLDELARVEGRITESNKEFDDFHDELMHPTKGLLTQMKESFVAYVDTKMGKVVAPLLVVAGGVVVSAISFGYRAVGG